MADLLLTPCFADGGHLVKVTYDGTNFTLSDPANPGSVHSSFTLVQIRSKFQLA